LEHTFDTLINSFIKDKIGITEGFLSKALSLHLTNNLKSLFSKDQLLLAGTGKKADIDCSKLVRGDKIFWLDRSHKDLFEISFFDVIDAFVVYLNRTCYTGITSYEFHYTLYEPGTFYKKHIDQFQNNDSRKYSMIFYLNENWKAIDGGELCIYQANSSQSISPTNGKSVFFKSNELEHEVLNTTKNRMSITGWFKVG
jgi:SM-20-related protein